MEICLTDQEVTIPGWSGSKCQIADLHTAPSSNDFLATLDLVVAHRRGDPYQKLYLHLITDGPKKRQTLLTLYCSRFDCACLFSHAADISIMANLK